MAAFDYSTVPLDEPDSIRLLRFSVAEEPGELLWAELRAFALHRSPSFAAISYAWGDPSDVVPISCNSSRGLISTPRSLHNFLIRFAKDKYEAVQRDGMPDWAYPAMRSSSAYPSAVWLWADAICINQSDIREKNSQVRLMSRIYNSAGTTLIWLGLSNAESWWFELLLIGASKCDMRLKRASKPRKYWQLNAFDRFVYGVDALFMPLNVGAPLFLQKGWFTRKWIVQELAMSYNPILILDRSWYKWQVVSDTLSFLLEMDFPVFDLRPLFRMYLLDVIRDKTQSQGDQSLLNLLTRTSNFACGDTRDRIYALLGLATDCLSGTFRIEPDYNIDVDDLMRTTTVKILFSTPRFDVLSIGRQVDHLAGKANVDHRQDPQSLHPAASRPSPTWALESRSTVLKPRPFIPITDKPGELFAENNAAPPSQMYETDLSIDGLKIRLSGYQIGLLQILGDSVLPDENEVARLAKLSTFQMFRQGIFGKYTVFHDWEYRVCNINSTNNYELTGETMREVYWQTLAAGQTRDYDWPQRDEWDHEKLMRSYAIWDRMDQQPFRRIPMTGVLAYLRPVFFILAFITKVLNWTFAGAEAKAACTKIRTLGGHSVARLMFRSEHGHIGLAPLNAALGDRVMLVKGCRTPMILRWIEEQEEWTLVGDSYVHGFMKGEMFDESRCESFWLS